MTTREGTKRGMIFTIYDVSKASGSAPQMCKTGHRVTFNPPWSEEGSYIEHIDTGEKMWLEERGGFYILNARVAPKHRQTSMSNRECDQWSRGFTGQVDEAKGECRKI